MTLDFGVSVPSSVSWPWMGAVTSASLEPGEAEVVMEQDTARSLANTHPRSLEKPTWVCLTKGLLLLPRNYEALAPTQLRAHLLFDLGRFAPLMQNGANNRTCSGLLQRLTHRSA